VNRIEKELAHIRETFVSPKKLSPYDRKKYCLKLMYINVLGYPIDFGHMEAQELIFSTSFQDKLIVLFC
jgi:AP-2 complex subunit alpha